MFCYWILKDITFPLHQHENKITQNTTIQSQLPIKTKTQESRYNNEIEENCFK